MSSNTMQILKRYFPDVADCIQVINNFENDEKREFQDIDQVVTFLETNLKPICYQIYRKSPIQKGMTVEFGVLGECQDCIKYEGIADYLMRDLSKSLKNYCIASASFEPCDSSLRLEIDIWKK